VSVSAQQNVRVGGMSISEVLTSLRGDFPDITISKIRFLESEGLVHPDRTPSGYRKFGADDLARLRYVLSQQRDHYLPLRVIKDQLDAIDRGVVPAGADGLPQPSLAAVGAAGPAASDFATGTTTMRMSREELLHATGLREDQLRELEQYGLVSVGSDGWYDEDALAVGQTVCELARYGIEGRHLRAFRTAADREVGLFAQVVQPIAHARGGDGRARAEETVRELAALSVRLHATLVGAGLREITQP
jgi:DNA-binding transcriptional MerR regulator